MKPGYNLLLAALKATEEGKEKTQEAITSLSAAKEIHICCFFSDLDGISTLIKKRKQLWLFLVANIFFVIDS